ncbi:MAG: ROK family protein [Candidatus Odinarchaeia archaeon]
MLGVDIGGQKILAVSVKGQKIVWMKKFPLKNKSREEVLQALRNISAEADETHMGVGVPGVLDGCKVVKCPNLQSLNGVQLDEALKGLKITVENDANCFAYGEYLKHRCDLVGITIGTGVGGGIVINGKIYRGEGGAGEFGHMTIKLNGRKCTCGNRGCLEEYVAFKALTRESRKAYGAPVTPRELYTLAVKGDKKAVEIFEKSGKYLGVGLANIVNILHPKIIVIGGGVSKAGEFLLKPAEEEMERRIFVQKPKIVLGSEVSGAYGAAILALQKSSSHVKP